MTQSEFLRQFTKGAVYLGDGWSLHWVKRKRVPGAILYRRDVNTGKYLDDEVKFETVDEAYDYKIGDKTISEIIAELTGNEYTEDFGEPYLEGGRGASSPGKKTPKKAANRKSPRRINS